jgi:hypothetical protein
MSNESGPEEQQEEYTIERIFKHKQIRVERKFLMKWKDYSDADATWNPEEKVQGPTLDEYLAAIPPRSPKKGSQRNAGESPQRSLPYRHPTRNPPAPQRTKPKKNQSLSRYNH